MPTIRRHFRRVETPVGVGTIQDGAGYLATVRYGLTFLQEIVGTQHRLGSSAVKGVLQITGRLHITSGSLPFEGELLTLRLDDGRDLAFQVTGSGPEYTVDATGSLM
jgi:hypothetical protein